MQSPKDVNELLAFIKALIKDPEHIGSAQIEMIGVRLSLGGNLLDFTLVSDDVFANGYIAGYIASLVTPMGLKSIIGFVGTTDPAEDIVRIMLRHH